MTSGVPYLDLHEPLDPTELTLLTWLLKNVHSVDYAMADLSPSYVAVTSRELGLQCNDSITMYHWKITRSRDFSHRFSWNRGKSDVSLIFPDFPEICHSLFSDLRKIAGCFSMFFPAKHPKLSGSSTFCVPLRCSSWSPLNASLRAKFS